MVQTINKSYRCRLCKTIYTSLKKALECEDECLTGRREIKRKIVICKEILKTYDTPEPYIFPKIKDAEFKVPKEIKIRIRKDLIEKIKEEIKKLTQLLSNTHQENQDE
jgi:hypothetical protein